MLDFSFLFKAKNHHFIFILNSINNWYELNLKFTNYLDEKILNKC